MLNLSLPASSGELLAMSVALIGLLGGLITLFAPRLIMRWTGLSLADGRIFGLSEIRGALGGFYVGVMLFVLLSDPRPYVLVSLAFGFFCFGRILAFVLDGVRNPQHVAAILGDATLTAIPLLYVTGSFSSLTSLIGW